MYSQNYNKPIIFSDFDKTTKATTPDEKISVIEHTFVVDSRQRDTKFYPYPSYYQIDLPSVYKNITSIELKGSVIPRTSYNIHSTNKYIDFSIGSGVTFIKVLNGGTGYTSVPTVTIGAPKFAGVQATAIAIMNGSMVNSILVTVNGSGYSTSDPPMITLSGSGHGVILDVIVGTAYTAELRTGQYDIGGNPVPPLTSPTKLLLEIQNAMNYAVNGTYDPASTSPFEVRLVNEYPTLTASATSPEAFNSNCCNFNRIQVTNINTDYWELLFSSKNKNRNSSIVMGFNSINYSNPVITTPVITADGTLFSGGTTYRAENDYDLYDDPKYVMLSFWDGSESFERIECKDSTLNRKFGSLVFDCVYSTSLKDTTGTTFTDGLGIDYLVGAVTKGPFWAPPGVLKPIRGYDFDQKKLEFVGPIGKLSRLTIKFTKFGTNNSDEYDFGSKNHLLIFSVKSADNKSGNAA